MDKVPESTPAYFALVFVVSVAILVSSVLLLMLCSCDMVFKNAVPISGYEAVSTGVQFPRVLHQTWKVGELRPDHARYRETWRRGLPTDWVMRLWTDTDLDLLVSREFPWFAPVWSRLIPHIKKVDTARYMLMYKFGGVYADLDMELKDTGFIERYLYDSGMAPPVAFVTSSSSRRKWAHDAGVSSPAILASHPGHPFWLEMLRYITLNYHRYVIEATGPAAMGNVIKEWRLQHSLVLLNIYQFGMGVWQTAMKNKYTYHVNTNKHTWKSDPDRDERPVLINHARVLSQDRKSVV